MVLIYCSGLLWNCIAIQGVTGERQIFQDGYGKESQRNVSRKQLVVVVVAVAAAIVTSG